jgi:organic hydroperoxide reductase OsmC/OhrA
MPTGMARRSHGISSQTRTAAGAGQTNNPGGEIRRIRYQIRRELKGDQPAAFRALAKVLDRTVAN